MNRVVLIIPWSPAQEIRGDAGRGFMSRSPCVIIRPVGLTSFVVSIFPMC